MTRSCRPIPSCLRRRRKSSSPPTITLSISRPPGFISLAASTLPSRPTHAASTARRGYECSLSVFGGTHLTYSPGRWLYLGQDETGHPCCCLQGTYSSRRIYSGRRGSCRLPHQRQLLDVHRQTGTQGVLSLAREGGCPPALRVHAIIIRIITKELISVGVSHQGRSPGGVRPSRCQGVRRTLFCIAMSVSSLVI